MFYVYEWFIVSTEEIIYVGKGHKNRYKVRKHNRLFDEMIKRFECDSRIIKEFESESEAFRYEDIRISELKKQGQCVCNIQRGGTGGDTEWWNEERRKEYSDRNVMKSKQQRKRMSEKNPMKDKKTALKVGKTKWRSIVIGNEKYESLVQAANHYGITVQAISYWLKRKQTPDLRPCYYDGEEKPIPHKITYSFWKPVYVDGKHFESVKSAAEYINVTQSSLIAALKNNRPCKGHICKYDNQHPSQTNTDKSSLEGSETNE